LAEATYWLAQAYCVMSVIELPTSPITGSLRRVKEQNRLVLKKKKKIKIITIYPLYDRNM
jgi:hypothetical protein